MRPNPCREFVFAHIARGDSEYGEHTGGIVGDQLKAVECEEQFGGDEGRALVAIDEGMVARQSPAVGGSQRSGIGLSIGGEILRPRQR